MLSTKLIGKKVMSLHENLNPPAKKSSAEPQKPGRVWTTVFEINPDEAITVQRILDTLRAKLHPHIDQKIIDEEAEELWGPDSDRD